MCFIFPPLEDEENHIYLLHFWDVFFVLGCVFEMGKDCVYNIYIYIGPACRFLTWCEAGLSCIVDAVFYRSSVLQGVFLSFMDSSVPLLFGSFIAGWLARDWVIPKNPEPQACKCHCNCNTTSAGEATSWNVGAVLCGLVAVVAGDFL